MAIRVYIDQGHNPRGFNTGAEGNGYYEQDITYEVGHLLYDLLTANSAFTAKLSRPLPDTVLGIGNASSLTARVRAAESFGADLFLSIHTNAAENTSATGSEALVYSPSSTVAVKVAEAVLAGLRQTTGLPNRGILYRPGLYVLRRTSMPAVLVELGFISNPSDAELMASSPGLFAEGIYRGLLRHYGVT